MSFHIDPASQVGLGCLYSSCMESASSFNLATLFKQSISSGSTSNVLSLSFHPINFTTVIWSVKGYDVEYK